MPRVSQILRDTPLRLRLRHVRNLPVAAGYWEAELKRTLSRQGSSSNRSRPGEAPRRQSGVLVASVATRVHPVPLSIVTTCIRYGVRLNEGGGRVAARPWIEITRRRVGPQVKRLAFSRDA